MPSIVLDVVEQHELAKADLKAASDEYEAAQGELEKAGSATRPNIVTIRKAEIRKETAQRGFEVALDGKEQLDEKVNALRQTSKRSCKRSYVEYLGTTPHHQVRITNSRKEHHTYRFDQVFRDSTGIERRIVFCNEPLDLVQFDRLKRKSGGRAFDLYHVHVSKDDAAELEELRRRQQEIDELRKQKAWRFVE